MYFAIIRDKIENLQRDLEELHTTYGDTLKIHGFHGETEAYYASVLVSYPKGPMVCPKEKKEDV